MGAISQRPWRSTQRPRPRKNERHDGLGSGLTPGLLQTWRAMPCGVAGQSSAIRADVVHAEEAVV